MDKGWCAQSCGWLPPPGLLVSCPACSLSRNLVIRPMLKCGGGGSSHKARFLSWDLSSHEDTAPPPPSLVSISSSIL